MIKRNLLHIGLSLALVTFVVGVSYSFTLFTPQTLTESLVATSLGLLCAHITEPFAHRFVKN
jgi:hypothetical protein